jgi:hypothetical protein
METTANLTTMAPLSNESIVFIAIIGTAFLMGLTLLVASLVTHKLCGCQKPKAPPQLSYSSYHSFDDDNLLD